MKKETIKDIITIVAVAVDILGIGTIAILYSQL
jgi:hypothetical protein